MSISCQQNVYFSDFLFHNKNNAYFLLHDAISKDTANDDEVSEEDMKQMEGTTMCESGVAVYRLCQSCSLRELVFLKVFQQFSIQLIRAKGFLPESLMIYQHCPRGTQ